jgi:DNA invertase Pin-like site-specific DNA recombinase
MAQEVEAVGGMKIAALYRVSTEKQENEGASLDAQQRRCRELAKASGWTLAFEFRGQESAAKAATERDVLQRLLTAIREGEVDAVWVVEQSRLTRADRLEVALLQREMVERGVRLIVGSDVRDLATIDGEMVFSIQSAVDRAEHRRIRERSMRGRREKARQGRKTGGRAPYGYRNPPPGDPDRGRLQPHPEEAVTVRRIVRDLAAGVPIRELARRLTAEGIPAPRGGSWSKSTLRRILENPVYTGTQVCGAWRVDSETGAVNLDLDHPEAIVVEGAHPALITRDELAAVRTQIRGTSNGRPRLLTGLLYLNGTRAWVDGGHGASFYTQARGESGGPWIKVDALDQIVWHGFRRMLTAPESVRSLFGAAKGADRAQAVAREMEALERQQAAVTARRERLVDLLADGMISREQYRSRSDAAERSLREMARRKRDLRAEAEATSAGAYDRAFEALRALLDEALLSEQDRRRALAALVGSVIVEARKVERRQLRQANGRFGEAARPAWEIRDVLLRVDPTPHAGATVC